jgi:hypothetical protein
MSMQMQPIQRFPNGMISPSKLSCYDKAVEMPGPCKAWNGKTVPPFTPPLGRWGHLKKGNFMYAKPRRRGFWGFGEV